MEKPGYVYVMASRRNGTLYIGVTSDLIRRVWQHREGIIEGFTKEYGCKTLVWYQAFSSIEDARRRELQMKEWKRAWKLREIEAMNPEWQDIYSNLLLFPGEGRGPADDAATGPRPSPGNEGF